MNDHYFSAAPKSASSIREIKANILGMDVVFKTDAGVFSKDGIDPGTRTLIEAMPFIAGRALDMGCGWGAAGVPLAMKNPECDFVLTDINERATELARMNAKLNGAKNIRVETGDAFEKITGVFDTIFTNPPIRAGKAVIYNMFATAREFLKTGGSLYIVIRKQQGAPSALKFLNETFENAEVVDKSGGYWVIRADKLGD